jgi:putative ABC transport system substrate-binding protein
MIRRRELLTVVGAALACPVVAYAQLRTVPTFGILLAFSSEAGTTFTKPLRAYMEALGYVEGDNISFDIRYADGRPERLPSLAVDLVADRPTVIATFGDAAGLAAKAATSDIPIVAMSEDLVRAELVNSMSRPEGNLTGLSVLGTELDAKRLEILAEVLPARSTILLLSDATTHRGSRPALNATAKSLGLTLEEAVISSPDEIDRALRSAARRGVAGINVLSSAFLFALRQRIIDAAATSGLPTMFQWPENADEGSLLAYGPSLLGAFRQVTVLVTKVLQGAEPRNIPVEQPTKFALYVNLNTAKALGLTIPDSILIRADKTIE